MLRRFYRSAAVAGAAALLLALASGCSSSIPSYTLPVVKAQSGDSNSSLQGAYAFRFQGFESGDQHIVANGLLTFDGNGNITGGSEQRTEDGIEFQFSLSGTYAVNSDGTGTLSITFAPNSVDTWNMVLADAGKRAEIVSIEPNNFIGGALSGELIKQ